MGSFGADILHSKGDEQEGQATDHQCDHVEHHRVCEATQNAALSLFKELPLGRRYEPFNVER